MIEDQGPKHVFPNAGPLKWNPWPSPSYARYWLVYGAIPVAGNPPTWGLATIDGDDVYETIYNRPRDVTRDALLAWVEPQTSPVAARVLVEAMSDAYPDIFNE